MVPTLPRQTLSVRVLSDYCDDVSYEDAFFNGRYNIHLIPAYRPQLAEEQT